MFRGMARTILESFIALDKQISEAIKTLVEGEISLPDPPNPLQQILMEVVMKNLQKNEPNIELVRGNDGKFKWKWNENKVKVNTLDYIQI